jgi:hypothetical protein
VISKILIHETVKTDQPSLGYNLITITEKTKPYNTMKKLLYILLFAFVGASAITACTEEEVAPSTFEANSSGAAGTDPK